MQKETAVAWRFWVALDDFAERDRLVFTVCDGLSAQYETQEVREGGHNDYVHHLPTRVVYTNVKLTRPVDELSGALAKWFSDFMTTRTLGTAEISVFDGNAAGGTPVATWSLSGVFPVRYTGPKLDASSTTGASETLELAHHGFMGG